MIVRREQVMYASVRLFLEGITESTAQATCAAYLLMHGPQFEPLARDEPAPRDPSTNNYRHNTS